MLNNKENQLVNRIFASLLKESHYNSGLTGFDSGLRWYVSMRSDGCILHNPFGRQLIGNNEYALAA